MALAVAALLIACNRDRETPTTITPSATVVGAGGAGPSSVASAGGMGGAQNLFPGCSDPGVTCDHHTYFGDCTQFPDRRTLWEFLHYDTVVPGDARIEFAVRTADTEEALADADFERASVAEMGAEKVFPSAPIHLDDVLGPNLVMRAWLELRIKLVSSTDGQAPSATEWDFQFSCVEF